MARLLIKNGRVWDGEGFLTADVLTDGPRIAKMEPGLTEPADFVFDAAGKLVTPGLVDAHVHMRGISSDTFGVDAGLSTIPFGVTTALDASAAFGDKALLDSFAVRSRVLLGAHIRENRAYFDHIDADLARYGDRTVGIKVYFDPEVSPVRDLTPLRQAAEFAHTRGLLVMVHSSNSPVPMDALLNTLHPGDILTHAYHGGGQTVAEDGFACIREAKARGIFIDAGLAGHIHTDFGIFAAAIRADAAPDIISTDITRLSANTRGGRYGLTMCMSIARTLGMDEAAILRAVTSAPARAIGSDAGTLTVGGAADIAVLDDADEGFDLTDRAGNRISSDAGYRCLLTVLDGEVLYRP